MSARGAASTAHQGEGAAKAKRPLAAALLVLALVWGVSAFSPFAWAQSPENASSSEASPSSQEAPPAGGKTDNDLDEQLLPDSSFIYDASIVDLYEADTYYDNQTVRVTGEAVGDNIRAGISGEYRWITLQATDSTFAEVSVFMTSEQAARIAELGNYGTRGDIVSVQGTFHLVCSEHDGLTDLHADSVTIIDEGYPIEHEFNVREFIPGIVMVAIGAILLFVFSRLRERLR